MPLFLLSPFYSFSLSLTCHRHMAIVVVVLMILFCGRGLDRLLKEPEACRLETC